MEGDKKRPLGSAASPDACAIRKKYRPSQVERSGELADITSARKISADQLPIKTEADSMDNCENTVASTDMCVFCFDSLMSHFFKKFEKSPPTFTNDSYPLFVTWQIGSEKRLRGCIGTFSSLSLHKGVKEYALTSAMSDSRFSPVTKDEISQLSVSVSLLVDFEDALNYLDWTVGIHGIKIEFSHGRSTKTATYLPEVAKKQEWTKEVTIESLLKKAGVKGLISQSLKDSIKLIRYRSEKVEMSFEEYAANKTTVLELLNGCYVPVSNGHGSYKYSNGYRH